MKRTLIIIGSIVFIIFLIVRMIIIKNRESDKIEREFVSRLGYDLSARVDSVGLFNEHGPVGFLYVKITRGDFENDEKKISRSLIKSGRLRFLVPRDSLVEIFSTVAREHQVGDSLVITTAQDKIVTYRAGNQVLESSISENLRRSGNQ